MRLDKLRHAKCPKVDEREVLFKVISLGVDELKIEDCNGMEECGVVSGHSFLWDDECYFIQHKDKLREVYEKPFREK